MEVNKIISQHLLLPKRFINTFGINPTVLLMELIDKELYHYKHNSLGTDGYFYHSKEYVFDNTALPRGKFDTARKKLEEQNLIFTKLGKGKKLHFKINNESINQIFYPKNQEMWDMNLSIEPFLDESYIRYPIALAHTIGINETIMIKDLLSKRNYFLKKGELKNGYFYNSVKNICDDTTLTKKQQLKCTKNLEAFELLHMKLDYDNTRYFCLNLEGIIEYEKIDIKKLLRGSESKKSTKVESKKSIEMADPFTSNESKKGPQVESKKSLETESNIFPLQKAENVGTRKTKNSPVEREKGHINNTKVIIPNNNIKQMKLLLSDLNFGKKFIDSLFEEFELLNISISLSKFSTLLQSETSIGEPLKTMRDLLEINNSLIERFYSLYIYDERIISETLIHFSSQEIEQIFQTIHTQKKKSPLIYIRDLLKKPFTQKPEPYSVENQVENLIEVQVKKWIENNEEDYEVMLQQEQIEILENNPLEEHASEKAESIIHSFIIQKKLKL
ncbi:MAG: hypothetical protein GY828_02890 [Candidatus Gracilibacteria bacterium]|nr:hypothetical protein [Candidatus Gracilibacteria bacterium]